MSDKETSFTELNCRLELWVRPEGGNADIALCDVGPPHFAPRQAEELYDWIAVEFVQILPGLSKLERRSLRNGASSHVHECDGGDSDHPSAVEPGHRQVGAGLHCTYYASRPPDARQ